MTPQECPFQSIYRHGFVRAAVGVPKVRVAAPHFNAAHPLAHAPRGAAAPTTSPSRPPGGPRCARRAPRWAGVART